MIDCPQLQVSYLIKVSAGANSRRHESSYRVWLRAYRLTLPTSYHVRHTQGAGYTMPAADSANCWPLARVEQKKSCVIMMIRPHGLHFVESLNLHNLQTLVPLRLFEADLEKENDNSIRLEWQVYMSDNISIAWTNIDVSSYKFQNIAVRPWRLI